MMLDKLLNSFNLLLKTKNWVRLDQYSVVSKSQSSNSLEDKSIDLTIAAIIHGDEVIGLDVIYSLSQKILNNEIDLQHLNICFTLGNIDAYKQNKRFIEDDLNRVIGANVQSLEGQHACRLERILSKTKFVLDIHQTKNPIDTPFFTSYSDESSIYFCHQLMPKAPIVMSKKECKNFECDTDSFVYEHGGVGVTLELGSIGDQSNVSAGVQACINGIKYLLSPDKVNTPDQGKVIYAICKKVTLKKSEQLNPNIKNFAPVKSVDEFIVEDKTKLTLKGDLYFLWPKREGLQSVYIVEKTTLGTLRQEEFNFKIKNRNSLFKNKSLTEVEVFGLNCKYNLSDGHSYIDSSKYYGQVLKKLPQIWKDASDLSIPVMEKYFKQCFADFYGLGGLHKQIEFSICPTASNSIDVVAAWASSLNYNVGLVEPTFDNLALLIRRRGASLTAIEESDLFNINTLRQKIKYNKIKALFIVNPNNPTGKVLSEQHLIEISNLCLQEEVTIIIDASFRFCHRKLIDDYKIFQDNKNSYIFIEDTGKCWPTLDSKASLLCYSPELAKDIRVIYEEIYLCSSNFTLNIISEFIIETQRKGGVQFVQNLIENRLLYLKEALKNTGLIILDRPKESCMSVVWLDTSFLNMTDLDFVRYLSKFNISLLPGRFFYWDS